MDTSAVTHERWSLQQVAHLSSVWGLLTWHQVEGSNSCLCLFQDTDKVNEIAQVSKQQQVHLNPGPLDR